MALAHKHLISRMGDTTNSIEGSTCSGSDESGQDRRPAYGLDRSCVGESFECGLVAPWDASRDESQR